MAASDVWDEKFEARWLKTSIEIIIKEVDKHHRNVNISRVAGSSVAFATGGTAAGLAIAAPFTMGVTLLPALILGIIAGVGGFVSVGASVVEVILKKLNVKEVQEKWDDFRQKYMARHNMDEIQNINARENGEVIGAAGSFVTGAARGAGGIAGFAVRGVKSATTAVRVVSPLLAAASFLALPLDLADLVIAAHNLRKKTRSSATESLEEIVKFLDTVINDAMPDKMEKENLKMKARQLHEKVESGTEELRKLHINVNISKVAGTVTNIAGGVFGVCTALVPFTFGAITPIAITVGGIGFVLSVGPSAVEFLVEYRGSLSLETNCKVFFQFFAKIYSLSPQREKEWCDWLEGKSREKERCDWLKGKSVLMIYNKFQKAYKVAMCVAEKAPDAVEIIAEVGNDIIKGFKVAEKVSDVVEKIVEFGDDIIKGFKVAGKVFAGLNIGGVVFDFFNLLIISHELYKRKGSLASERFERYNVLFMLVINDDEDKLLHAEMSTIPTTVRSLLSDNTTVDSGIGHKKSPD